MKTSFKLAAVLGAMLAFAACQPEDKPVVSPEEPKVEVKADFSFEVNNLEVVFTNKSEGAASYKWEFGDGETSKEVSPTHTYASAGEYTVKLTAANADGETAKAEKKVQVSGAVKAYFTYKALDGRAGKFGKIVSFDATASENASSIAWDFGDGQTSSEFKADHEFPEFGEYEVKATVKGDNGSEDVYSQTVEVIANNELLKGGEMNEGDEQYWTIAPIYAHLDDSYVEDPTKYCWTPTFGYTDDKPTGGEGGCLRLVSETSHDWANNFLMYQTIEVEEGDVLRVSAEMKWGENNNNNGLLWFGFTESDPHTAAPDYTAVIEMYNYWANTVSIPAFDGNFAANESWLNANTEMGLGYSGDGETPYVEYTVEKTGTLYFYMNYRCVWSVVTIAKGREMFFDSFSVKIII